jgi:disulfide bond formation protein DsbB
MTDQLYRRCPACLDAGTDAPCPSCNGARFVPAGVTLRDVARLRDQGNRRLRIRISTLMLLVVISALASCIVAVWWHEAQNARRLAAAQARAVAEFQQAQASAAQAQAKTPTPTPAWPTK